MADDPESLFSQVEPDSAQDLFEKYSGWALNIAKGWLKRIPPQDRLKYSAGEIKQAALIGLWQAAESYDPIRRRFKPWASSKINISLINLFREEHKWRSRNVSKSENFGVTDADGPDEILILNDEAAMALIAVPPKKHYREVFQLTALGYTQFEIADRLKISRSLVTLIVREGRKAAADWEAI